MKRTAAGVLTLLAGLLLVNSLAAGETEDPRDWLERMATAMSQMSYQGTFVYMQDGQLETMRITHVAGEDGVHERLVSVSGTPREIIRGPDGVSWVLGDDGSVLRDSAFTQTFFPELPLDRKGQADKSYTFVFGEHARIAGQATREVRVVPRDAYRYGYALWMEPKSGLLLQWELLGSNRKPMARLTFTEIRLGSEVDRSELRSDSRLTRLRTVQSELPEARKSAHTSPVWKPSRLPPGFSLTTRRYYAHPEPSLGMFEHLVYSDGLAAVSVYVESLGDKPSMFTGTKRHGTTHAFHRATDEVMITVVGDVPAETVELIGNAVSRATPRPEP